MGRGGVPEQIDGDLVDDGPVCVVLPGIDRGVAPFVEALKAARIDEAFAGVLDAAADAVMTAAEDPYDFDDRLHADNLGGAASDIRRAFHWL
ncbi:hypothetical protein ABZ778_29525 [Streptomyces bacillaris]|uniref:hypothetical protein n=1 Tax=Streptomyces bacillaris TaxID=68179 RepID=UPI0034616D21